MEPSLDLFKFTSVAIFFCFNGEKSTIVWILPQLLPAYACLGHTPLLSNMEPSSLSPEFTPVAIFFVLTVGQA